MIYFSYIALSWNGSPVLQSNGTCLQIAKSDVSVVGDSTPASEPSVGLQAYSQPRKWKRVGYILLLYIIVPLIALGHIMAGISDYKSAASLHIKTI